MHPRNVRSFRYWVENVSHRKCAPREEEEADNCGEVDVQLRRRRANLHFGHRARPPRLPAEELLNETEGHSSSDFAWRNEQIEKLQSLTRGSVTKLLTDPDGNYSEHDIARTTFVGLVLLQYLVALNDREEGTSVHATAEMVAARFGPNVLSGRTVRQYLSDYSANGCLLTCPSTGKWEREILISENDVERDQSLSMTGVPLAGCEDFLMEVTVLQELVSHSGHFVVMTPKGHWHCELAGQGIEYCWGKSKKYHRRNNRTYKRGFKKPVHESMSRAVISFRTSRKFARVAREYTVAYASGKAASYVAIERMINVRLPAVSRCVRDAV